jgi:hypothetical protein
MMGGQVARVAWGYGTQAMAEVACFEFDRTHDHPDFFLAGPIAVCRGM